MASLLKAVVGNTAPTYQWTADRDDGTIIDLTGTTVTMKLYTGGVQTNTASGHDACIIVGTATAGVFSWVPKAGDLPTAGKYLGDVKVTYGDSTFEVLYNKAQLKVRALTGS